MDKCIEDNTIRTPSFMAIDAIGVFDTVHSPPSTGWNLKVDCYLPSVICFKTFQVVNFCWEVSYWMNKLKMKNITNLETICQVRHEICSLQNIRLSDAFVHLHAVKKRWCSAHSHEYWHPRHCPGCGSFVGHPVKCSQNLGKLVHINEIT